MIIDQVNTIRAIRNHLFSHCMLARFGKMGAGGLGRLLASAAKRKALCNLGHCKEQLQQPSPARGRMLANSLVATPLNLFEDGERELGWGGCWEVLLENIRGRQWWETAVLSHTARMLRFEWEGVMRGEKWRQ